MGRTLEKLSTASIAGLRSCRADETRVPFSELIDPMISTSLFSIRETIAAIPTKAIRWSEALSLPVSTAYRAKGGK